MRRLTTTLSSSSPGLSPPPAGLSDVFGAYATLSSGAHCYLQFWTLPSESDRLALERVGIKLFGYLPNKTFYAYLPAGLSSKEPVLSLLRWGGAIAPSDKLEPAVAAGRFGEHALDEQGNVRLIVEFFPDVSLDEAGALIGGLGGATISRVKTLNALVAAVPAASVWDLAARDEVEWAEQVHPPLTLHNDGARQAIGADGLQPPFGIELCGTSLDEDCDGSVDEADCNLSSTQANDLTGKGVKVLNYDCTLADPTHPDFLPASQCRLEVPPGEFSTLNPHPTHTSGTIGGSGRVSVPCGQYRGIAPAAAILSMGVANDVRLDFCKPVRKEESLLSDPGDVELDYSEAINKHRADLSSNSIGSAHLDDCSTDGGYSPFSALLDSIIIGKLGKRFPSVWSAGNNKDKPCPFPASPPPTSGSVSSSGCAKNNITVGAVNSNDLSPTAFSSIGPCDDGRRKPDVLAPGAEQDAIFSVLDPNRSIWSTAVTNPIGDATTAGYEGMRGTSMAAPVVAGGVALLLEEVRRHAGANAQLQPSTAKALLIHDAIPHPEGWGVIQIKQSVDRLRALGWREATVGNLRTVTFSIEIPPGAPEIKATLAWDDEPGSGAAAKALVNDLTLRLVNPQNVTFQASNPLDGTSPDTVNNVEQVIVASPASGAWKVEVFGENVVTTPSFSVVLTPPFVTAPGNGTVRFERHLENACSHFVPIRLLDSDLAGQASVSVSVNSTTQATPVTVTLSPDTRNPALFKGLVLVGPEGTKAPLKVAKGDTLTVTY